jgi:hypothetical protein
LRASIRSSIFRLVLPAGLALSLLGGPVNAQRRAAPPQAGGIAGSTQGGSGQGQKNCQNGQLITPTQLQTTIQQTIALLQAYLQQIQNGQVTLPSNSPITLAQLQTLVQQQIAQLQALLPKGQNGTTQQSALLGLGLSINQTPRQPTTAQTAGAVQSRSRR